MENNEVRYHAVVKEVSDGHLQVGIVKSSACGGCSIKGHCNSAEAKERLVDVYDASALNYSKGQDVWLVGSSTMGWKALAYGIGIPFLIVFVSIVVLTMVVSSELWVALIALFLLTPYYIILYKNKEKMKRQFAFSVAPFEVNNN